MKPEAKRGLDWYLAVIASAGFVIRIAIAWMPIEWLLRYVLADDSFYYFTIARNASHGLGFTFDGLAETNGFHPLWMICLLPLHLLTGDKILFVHLTLSLSALLDMGSLLLLHRLFQKCGVAAIARRTMLCLFACAPALLSHTGTMNGMETALNTLLLIAFLYAHHAVYSSGLAKVSSALRLGIVTGLLLLARTDNIILVVVCYLFLVWTMRKRIPELSLLGVASATSIALVLPWLTWSYVHFGTIVQVSGLALGSMTKIVLASSDWSTIDYFVQFLRNFGNTTTHFPVYLSAARIISIASLVQMGSLLLLAGSVLWSLRRRGDIPVFFSGIRWLIPPVVAAILFVLVHTIRTVYMRGWYYSSITPIFLVVLGVLLAFANRRESRATSWSEKVIAAFALGLVLLGGGRLLSPHYGEIDKFAMVQRMNILLPKGSIVGSWNAGVYGYFFERGSVVALDGLVNNEVYPYIVEGRVAEYCERRGVRYLVDPIGSFDYARPFWQRGTTLVTRSLDPLTQVRGQKEGNWIVLGMIRE